MTTARNEMILASAGTGKTYTLSSRYLCLLVDGVHPQAILATTFTRKAAGEILDRIFLRLAAAALDEKVALRTATHIGRPGTSRQQFADLLVVLTRNLNNLQVETLDAFFGQVARSFSLDLGLPPDWEIVEDDEMSRYQNLAIRRSLNQPDIRRIVHDLAKGEAKRGISSMVRNTVNDLYNIYRETADSGTLDAWDRLPEMKTLTVKEVDEIYQRLLLVEPAGSEQYIRAFKKDLSNIANRDWMALPTSNLAGAIGRGVFQYYRKPIQPEIVELLGPLVAHATAQYINILTTQTRAASQFLQRFHMEFLRVKMQQATLRFDDVCYLANRLLSKYNAGQLAYRMDKHIDHLLLDEFQDTSIEQWQVLKPIARQTCRPGPNRSFFCVGDEKQAIYGWRGGVAEIFEDVQIEFGDDLEEPARLNKSWRSSGVVIDAVNRIFQGLTRHRKFEDKHFALESWCRRFKPHETQFPDRPGYVSLEKTAANRDHEQQVAERIGELATSHPDNSIGVLVRSNKCVARLIFELGLIGVRASEEGGNPLTDSAAVNLVLSCLRLIDQPDDLIARYHVLHSPLGNSFRLTQQNWRGDARSCRESAGRYRQQLMDCGYGELISEWANVLNGYCTTREWFRLSQLIEKAFRVSVADHTRTRDFVSWVETTRIPDPAAARIRVMTIHKSKGLEFDMVVLPDLEFPKGHTPTCIVGRERPTSPVKLVCRYMDSVKQEWLPEEFRVAFSRTLEKRVHETLSTMYVALTRARYAMHMMVPPSTSSSNRSAGGLVMAALEIKAGATSDSGSKLLWQSGNPEWKSELPVGEFSLSGKPETPQTQAKPGAPPHICFAKGGSARNLPWESPSAREGGDKVHLGRLLQLEDNRDARIHGSLIHACFEQIDWLDDSETQWNELALQDRLGRVKGASPTMIRKALTEFKKMLRQPVLSGLLSKQQYQQDLFDSWDEVTVRNEHPFAVRIGERILTGFVDRLVLLKRNGVVRAADVIDFKTDTLTSGDHEGIKLRTEIYRPQLLAYRDAVANMLNLPADHVSARLMYATIDRHVQID